VLSPLLILAAALSPALAQDAPANAYNAHGFTLVPDDGHPMDLMSTWRPEAYTPLTFGAQAVFEYAEKPLVLHQYVGEERTMVPLVDNLFGANLGVQFGANPRFAFTAAMPVWFTSIGPEGVAGAALGDLRIAAPVSVLAPEPGVQGFGFTVIPFLDLPSGNLDRFLGAPGVGGGLLLASGVTTTNFHLTGNLGFEGTQRVDYYNLTGGSRFLAAVGGAYMINDEYAARMEVNLRPTLFGNVIRFTETPGETILSGRGSYSNGLYWTGGVALPYTRGATAAQYRVFAGIGYHAGPPPEKDTDLDGLVDVIDLCPLGPEDFNGYKDDDGCPDVMSTLVVTVEDPEGNRLSSATVEVDGETFPVDGNGQLTLEELMPGTSPVLTVGAPYMISETVSDLTLVEGLNEVTVALEWMPGRVKVITRSNKGAIVDSAVRFDGPKNVAPQQLGDDGEELFELPPGQWRAIVTADSFGTERRDFTINPGETSLIVIEILLNPTKVEFTEKEIIILEQVNFDFDKDTIKAESLPLLDEVANTILYHPEILLIEVQGHTDSKGNDAYNQDLSQRRVNSVVKYLASKGVTVEILKPVGYGEAKPIASNSTAAGRAKNRRVQFVILDTVGLKAAREAEEAERARQAAEGQPTDAPPPTTNEGASP